jgi:hypothetical protein
MSEPHAEIRAGRGTSKTGLESATRHELLHNWVCRPLHEREGTASRACPERSRRVPLATPFDRPRRRSDHASVVTLSYKRIRCPAESVVYAQGQRRCYGVTSYRSGTSVTCKRPSAAIEYTVMPNRKRKEGSGMATSTKHKSAMDTLLDTMRDVIDEGARGMTPKERAESEKKFNASLDRAVAARKRRRETA